MAPDFVSFAGVLWLKARRQSAKITDEELSRIGWDLDEKGYIPPAKYLEKKYADELKTYNSRNSNSKAGTIKTWSQLVSVADKDHVRGMRRLLSRCAEKRTRP